MSVTKSWLHHNHITTNFCCIKSHLRERNLTLCSPIQHLASKRVWGTGNKVYLRSRMQNVLPTHAGWGHSGLNNYLLMGVWLVEVRSWAVVALGSLMSALQQLHAALCLTSHHEHSTIDANWSVSKFTGQWSCLGTIENHGSRDFRDFLRLPWSLPNAVILLISPNSVIFAQYKLRCIWYQNSHIFLTFLLSKFRDVTQWSRLSKPSIFMLWWFSMLDVNPSHNINACTDKT